ncbi:MAG: hypothetical protein SFY92_10030, partial [Verrucomicrobiae bacterium]|nr:hypothetical protein [Verrucomicrobiae bacterium]
NNTISSAGGAVALSGANGTVLSGAGTLINTAGGAFSVNADSDANGTGLYQQLGTTVVNTAGGAVSIVSGTGVSFAAGTGINSGAADITLNSSTGPINLGTLTSGNYLVVGTDLTGLATTGAIVFGDRTQNKQILASGFNVGANNVRMATAGTIENVAGTAVTTTGTITLDAAGGIGTNGSLLVDAPGLAILTEGPVVDVVDAANLASLVVRTDGTVTNQNVVAGNLAAYNVSENITTQDTVINAVTATTPMNFVYSNTVGNVTFGAVDLTATGNLSLFTTKTATQGAGAITVNNVNVIAGAGTDFILNNAANVINGSISATGTGGNLRDVTLVDSTPLDMGTVTINRNLTVQGADITQSGVLTVGGTATFTANTGQDIILNNVGNSITGAVTFIGNGGNLNNLSFANTQSIANAPMTLAGNLTLNSTAGTVSVAATTVGGNLSLTGTSVSQTGALAVTGNSTITAANGQSITLTDAGNNFAGTVDFVAASGTLQNVSIRDTSTLDLAALTLNGNLNVDAFNITQTGPLAITGTTTVTAAAGQDITLNDAGNVFTGALTFAGSGGQLNNVTLLNNGAVSLGGVDLLGNLGVTAQTITSSGALLVDGNSLFTVTAPNSDLLFAGSANDFAGMVTFATAGAGTIRDIGFRNINAGATTPVLPAGLRNLALAFDALAYDLDGSLPVITGNLAITAGGGNITQSATLNLPGNLTLNSGVNDIIITDPANVVVGSVSLIGANVTYAQATDINLGMSSSPGTVDLTTGGGITQSSSLTAGTLTATTGGPIALTGSGNQISSLGTIDRGGAFTLNNVSSLAVNAPLTAGTVNNNVTISVSGGNLTLNAPIAGQNISLNSQGFYNNSGSSALQTSGGTWQIFVPDPSNVQFGGLSSGATFVFGSTSASGQSGNVIIFGQGGNVGSSLLVNPSSATDLSAGLFVLNPWYDSTYPRNQINYGDAFFNLYTVVPVYAGGFTRDFQNFTSLSGFNPNNYMAFYSSFFYDPDYTYGYY